MLLYMAVFQDVLCGFGQIEQPLRVASSHTYLNNVGGSNGYKCKGPHTLKGSYKCPQERQYIKTTGVFFFFYTLV